MHFFSYQLFRILRKSGTFLALTFICIGTSDVIGEPASAPHHDIHDHTSEEAELYINGSLSPIGLDRLGKPVSIITHQKLRERSEPTIGELLANEPGVSSTYFGPGASRPVIRGQSKQRVRMLENGLESGDLSDVSEDHAVSADPISVQRVDVLRGSSTLLYGSSAIGGAVNLIDQSIAETPVGSPLTGEIDLRKGDTADNENTGALTLNGEAGKFNWHLSNFYRETDDIKIPGYAESPLLRENEIAQQHADEETTDTHQEAKGTLKNTAMRSKGLKVGASRVWNRGFWGIGLKTFDSRYGVPGTHHEESSIDEDHTDHNDESGPTIDLKQFRLESRGEIRNDDGLFRTVRFGTAYSSYEHKELEGREIATIFDKNSLDSRLELMHGHKDGFQGSWGTQIRLDDLKAAGKEAFIPSSETFAPALFVVEDYKINERLVWQIGGRYEYTQVRTEDITHKHFNMMNASTGLVINLDTKGAYTTGLTVSYSERAPTATELFAQGAHLATQTFEIGDPNLNKERSLGSEIVFKKNLGKLNGQASFFLQEYSDYINLTPSGKEEDGLPQYFYELGRARFWGFESEADYELFFNKHHAAHLYGQIDYVRADNLSRNEPLPRITPLRTKVGLRYEHDCISGYLESLFISSQERTAEFELPTDNYTMLNGGAAYQIPTKSTVGYEIYLRATNLLNEEARAHTSFLKDIAPLRGRAFFAGIKLTF